MAGALPISSLESIPIMDVDLNLNELEYKSIDHFCHVYWDREKSIDDNTLKAIYNSLGHITSFSMNFEDRTEPYGPLVHFFGEGRSMIPDDLNEDDLPSLIALFGMSHDPQLKARIADVLQLRLRSKERITWVAKAIANYLEASKFLFSVDDPSNASKFFLRANVLAYKFQSAGDQIEAFKERLRSFAKEQIELELKQKRFHFPELFKIAVELKLGDASEWECFVDRLLEDARSVKPPRFQRIAFESLSEFYRWSKQPEKAKELVIESGKTFFVEGDEYCDSKIFAADYYSKGLTALKRAGLSDAELSPFSLLFIEASRKARGEFKIISTPIDVKDVVETCIQSVRGKPFDEAISALCSIPLLDEDHSTSLYRESTNNLMYPKLVGLTSFHPDGRLINKSTGTIGLEGDALRNQESKNAIQSVARIDFPLRAQAMVHPMLSQIWLEHNPQLETIRYLVENNPVVPQGHEAILARGIIYGFQGDFILAGHLLIPQFESIIRSVLQSHQVNIIIQDNDGSQQNITLTTLLRMDKTKEVFGNELCFELDVLLANSLGFNLRNELAHGLMSYNAFYNPALVLVWWHIVRLCWQGWTFNETLRLRSQTVETPNPIL